MKHVIIVAVAVTATVALAGLGLYKYQHTNKGISLQTALVQRDVARGQVSVAQQRLTDQKQVSAYNAGQDQVQLASVCASLKVAKATNQYCK